MTIIKLVNSTTINAFNVEVVNISVLNIKEEIK